MWNLGRAIIVFMIFPSSVLYGSSSSAQSGKSQPENAAPSSRTCVDGKFGYYLASPTGGIVGVVLEDGTVARFPLFSTAPQTVVLRPGDAIHVEGDGASGPSGTVLLNAVVAIRRGVAIRADEAAKPSTARAPSHSYHRHRRLGLTSSRATLARPMVPAAKTPEWPGGIWLKIRNMTTGTGHVGDDPRWKRTEETSGL